ncbi:hypothetical protein HPB49_003946 [Dermacentor silvarum]|uniref:Uncharacterized protein n=1 Tax=Dermacentor silvarum TaxID=543639 RepID=A0ACB8DUB7_DERSI|nr:hypothetical protein HPB49_003946 [Dermacentor silvarum]
MKLGCLDDTGKKLRSDRNAFYNGAYPTGAIDKDPLQPGYELTRENERSLSDRQAADVCYGPALMISSVLVLFCLVSFLSGVVNRRLMAAQRLTCSSNLCLRFADVINRSATARVPPCSDFYAHVCAEWDQGNLESPQELQFRSIVERLYLRLAREPVPTHNQTSFQKAAGFYQSCLAVLLDGKSELREISKALRRVGVRWPQRSEDPDLLVTAAMLKQWFDLDSVLVFSMPDTATLSVGPPSTDWLHDIKRQRYAVDFADNSLEHFRVLSVAFGNANPNETEIAQLRAAEELFFNYIVFAGASSPSPPISRLTLAALPVKCSEFSRDRWDKLLREAYDTIPEAVTAVEIRDFRVFDAMCRLVRDLGESAIQYYVEWLAVGTLAMAGDRSIAEVVWNGADMAPLAAQSTCFRTTMLLFGETVLLEESRRWHLQRPALLSDSHCVAKKVRDSLSQLIRDNRSHPSANSFRKDWLHDQLYNDDRERLVESVYATVPDMSEGFFFNRMLLLNVSLNRDTLTSLGFSWDELEDMLRHDGGSIRSQLPALQQDVRLFLQLSYATYLLLSEDMPPMYNYAALGMLLARQLLAFRRHSVLIQRTRPGSPSQQTEELAGELDKERTEFSLALDIAQEVVFRTHQYKAHARSRRSQDFFLLTCFQVCSGRNTNEDRRNFTLAFTASKGFQKAFSCRTVS